MNLLQNSIDETSITLLSCSLSFHNFRSSLALATFLGAFLCRALFRALHRRRLSNGTHLKSLLTTIVRCSLLVLATETDLSKDCTPIYVLGSDRNGKSKRGSKVPIHSIFELLELHCFLRAFDSKRSFRSDFGSENIRVAHFSLDQ